MSRGVDAEGEYERAGKFMMKQGPAGISALGDVGHAWNCTIYCDWRLPSGESMGQDRNHGEKGKDPSSFLNPISRDRDIPRREKPCQSHTMESILDAFSASKGVETHQLRPV
jgi:hypothetical protein